MRKYLIALVVSPDTHQEYLNKKKDENLNNINNSSFEPNLESNKVIDDLDDTKNEM